MAEHTEVARVSEINLTRLDPQALIEKALETGAAIDTMERLVALAKDVRDVQAQEAWYAAMAEFQRKCPPIKKTATAKIATRTGPGYTYRYAPLDEILSIVQPVMGPLGLSISWRSRVEPKQVIVSCRISHTLGHHEESGEIAMPILEGEMGANPAQRVGIAATYAKRYALLGIIGMAPEDDDDTSHQTGGGKDTATQSGQDPDAVITENQVKRFSAIANGMKWTDEQVYELLAGYEYKSRKEIRVKDYEKIVNDLKAGPQKQRTLA